MNTTINNAVTTYEPVEIGELTADQLKDVINNLKAAKALIIDPIKFCTGAIARDPMGKEVTIDSDNVYSCCSVGALKLAREDMYGYVGFTPEYKYLVNAMKSKYAAEYNDTHTHAEVLAKFDEAIELACVDLINLNQSMLEANDINIKL